MAGFLACVVSKVALTRWKLSFVLLVFFWIVLQGQRNSRKCNSRGLPSFTEFDGLVLVLDRL